MATAAPTLNFCGVLSESKRIINAHSRHFLALSVLFILPLSFSFIMYPTLEHALVESDAHHTAVLLRYASAGSASAASHRMKILVLPLIYTVFVLLFSLCAVATVTYSTYHGFYGRPVKIMPAIKSLFHSFLPLFATSLVSNTVILLICVLFALLVIFVTKVFGNLGFEVDYSSNYYTGLCIAVLIILATVLVYLQVNWALAFVIVVVESRWGLEPLQRSSFLVRGMKGVSLSLFLFFSALIGVLMWGSTGSAITYLGDARDGWKSWAFILQAVLGSSLLTLLMLHSAAASTVLYMYCKAMHGELAWEIAEEFAREYVSLPYDDGKVPYVVSVVQA